MADCKIPRFSLARLYPEQGKVNNDGGCGTSLFTANTNLLHLPGIHLIIGPVCTQEVVCL